MSTTATFNADPKHSKVAATLRHRTRRSTGWRERDPSSVPLAVQFALRDAMRREQVADVQYDDLLWIMAQESSGMVGVRNARSTARGLFQLLRAQYPLNPHGEDSFGNAVEECQGGIRYVMGRYHSAAAARRFWQRHHWY
ncbi:MAG: aggregation-promoting factor C-terminal-like domain-containing protein [Telluria sp.]